jgi:flagellar protein FlbT
LELIVMSAAAQSLATLRVPVRSGDRFLVNGAVVGVEEGALVLHMHDTVLRGEDVMLPEQANSPSRRVYFWITMMLIDPASRDAHYSHLIDDLTAMLQATSLADVADTLNIIFTLVRRGCYDRALASARALVHFETELMRMAAPEKAA